MFMSFFVDIHLDRYSLQSVWCTVCVHDVHLFGNVFMENRNIEYIAYFTFTLQTTLYGVLHALGRI